jgi:hypothetical protein
MTQITHKNIAAALAAAQSEMGKALKSANNPHFRSKYADLASVMDACLPSLNAHGIAVVQPTIDDERGRYVETVLIHGDSDGELRCRVPLIVQKNDMQGYGSAVTYARRYGLMSMAGIAPEDDDGNAAAKAAPKGNPELKREQRGAQQEPSGPPQEAIDTAKTSLAGADSLDQLKAIWSDLPKQVQIVPDVIQSKDARKTELQAEAEHDKAVKDDLGGDGINY